MRDATEIARISLVARPNNVDVCYNDHTLDTINTSGKNEPDESGSAIRKSILPILDLVRPDTFVIGILKDKKVFEITHTFDDMLGHAKNDKKVLDEMTDGDDNNVVYEVNQLHSFFTDEMLTRPIESLVTCSTRLALDEEIKDKECPVLHEPLTRSALKFKDCGHYISREAWFKMEFDKTNTGAKRCPLCRAPHCAYQMMNF